MEADMDNVLKLPTNILLRKFIIDFSYITSRGNKKMRTVEIKSTSPDDAQFWLFRWIEKFNNDNPQKPYLNAQILRYEEVDREVIEI